MWFKPSSGTHPITGGIFVRGSTARDSVSCEMVSFTSYQRANILCTYIKLYDSVVTLALAFVTFTPSCFAFAIISTLFLDETECEILL